MSGENYLTAETPPDAITWDSLLLYPQTEHRDLFMDIGPLWKQEGWEDVIPDNLQALSQSAGRYYHVPTHYFWNAFYYNKAVFEQHDLKEPETWDEFLTVCATLEQAGVTPITIGFGSDGTWTALLWFEHLNMRINGLEFRNELMLEGQVPFDDPRVREVFATLQTLLDEGYFNEDYGRLSPGLSFVSVLDGEAAMVFAPGVYLLDLLPETRWDELDFFPIVSRKGK